MIEQLVISLDQMNEKPAAVTLLDALARNSTVFEQFDELGKSYFKIKEYEKAHQAAEKALSLYNGTDLYSVKYNTLNTANHANYPERAMILIKQLELISPDDIDLQMEKAFALFLLNQKDKAEEVLREQLENPKVSEKIKTKIRFNLGTYELLRDEFQSGLRKFLFEGRKLDFWKKPTLPFIPWDGMIHKDKTIYIRAEAGIGDEFINIRFMNHLKELGMHPIWYTDRQEMAKIFNRNGYEAITEVPKDAKDTAYWVHSMDLPIYLNLGYKDLWNGQYLKADPKKVEKWKQFFNETLDTSKPIIGVRWQGNPGYDQDLHRSIPLSDIVDVLPKNANLVSIQRDTGLEEIKSEYNILDLSEYMTDFEETLAILENLDTLITSCTSVGHASAAMNKRTVIITPISAYYTWCHSTEKSPWYGNNLDIFRQERPRVWKEPMTKLKEVLDAEFSI